ncbi:N-acetyltransferase [Bradyrhizobium sp. SSBR45G]|uniref:GNAT family N-acetyltransferase n=1 Tax=unclassified Bradyrhizobium TaxID=2631580 RepID=UPI002342A236|nr:MULTISPECIES: GNAT family N-acetyltransferase [unclassified Bradyrhizobium]GLH77750.1 N-acetyltransferase [Bradyrhizobium sp. SSBR45G]GLH84987.1 N-acetyltransferase [Bradyrhizobium sp. SSBR45R]
MDQPIIRPARPDEYDAIAKLWMESWCSTGLESPSDRLLTFLKERVPREVENGWSLYVADDGGQLAAMLAINLDELYLDQLMIAPSHQGRSLGRRLLAFTRELLPDEVWLRCAEGNGKAWRWYEREGFVVEKTQADPLHGRMMKYYRWKRQRQPTAS